VARSGKSIPDNPRTPALADASSARVKSKSEALLGPGVQKASARLRVIANGDREVNAVRAFTCDSVAISRPVKVARAKKARDGRRRRKLKALARDVLVNVFISTETNRKLPSSTVAETGRLGRLATATVPLTRLRGLLGLRDVRHVELGQSLKDPTPLVHAEAAALVAPERTIAGAEGHHFGQGVIVGIIDVGGFDFSHPDFLTVGGETRFAEIWDQGARKEADAPFGYGRLISRERMNAAIRAARKAGAPATRLEPQTQMSPSSHATHVTSIAAGNNGICRQAEIVGVLVSLPEDDLGRRKSFYDSTRIAHAVSYLHEFARRRRKPLSINVSLGTNGHSHDATAPVNRWVDAILTEPGRSLCVAAGNAGQEAAMRPGDMGFLMGRVHSSGRIGAAGLTADLEWVVGGDGVADYSENECEAWFAPQDRFGIALRLPNGTWTETVEPREFIENRMLPDSSVLSIYNELYHTANGLNRISIYLSPNLKTGAPVSAGTWTIRLSGREVRDGRFHAWIERDDPVSLSGFAGARKAMRYPSCFSAGSNVDNSSISTLACAGNVIAVANLDAARERINVSSSQGPTRDGRPKPDIAAPGTAILAANGFADLARPWVAMTGTSMASPYVCGVAGLMLARTPTLTAAQIAGILHRTAVPLPGSGYEWRDDCGFGRINPAEALKEAAGVNDLADRTR
jgi:subtilisin family serine protease